MENTLENKAKFFALYWGQKLGKTRYSLKIQINKSNILSIDYLELTPLHLISDEDAIEVAKILGVMVAKDFMYAKHGLSYLEKFRNNQEDIYCSVADLLRSKGYALPFNSLSVEQQVQRGWVALKTKI